MAIADDIVGHAHIAYLGDPFEQYCGLNGKPLIGGCIEVYHAGTDTRYITMQNFDGAMNPFKIPLNADGRVVMLADPSLTYDIYVRNSYGDLVCSRLNVECTCPGNISISGSDTRIKNTDGTLDVSLRTLGNNVREYTVNTHNKVLDVQEPLYFVENSNTATVIGFSGDSSSSISGKMDESKLEYNAYGEISAYNGSAFAGQSGAGGAGDPAVNALVHTNSATWNEVSAKLDTTAFSTVSGSFLTAHQDLSQYAKTEDLTAYQEQGDYYSASNPSGFLTKNSADTLYQPTGDYATLDNLTAYQNVEGMTAYQPKGDYADTTALDGKVDTSSFTAFSSTTNEKIEYISGALSGTYELSAGSGIDITDYPNEKKTVIRVTAQCSDPVVNHDNTLSGNGTSASPLGVVPGYNETVLWSGNLTVGNSAQMTEPVSAFERYKFYLLGYERKLKTVDEFWTDGASTGNEPYKVNSIIFQVGDGFFTINAGDCKWNASWNNLQYVTGYNKWMPFTGSAWNQINTNTDSPTIVKIVGINRKQ